MHILHMQGWWKLKHPEEVPAVQLQRPRVQRRLTVSQLIASARSSIPAQPRESPDLSLSSGCQASERASPDVAVSCSFLLAATSLSSEEPLSTVLPRVGEHARSSPSVLCNHRKRCPTNGSGSTLGKLIYTVYRYPHIWYVNILTQCFVSASAYKKVQEQWCNFWKSQYLQVQPTYLMYEFFIFENIVRLRIRLQ